MSGTNGSKSLIMRTKKSGLRVSSTVIAVVAFTLLATAFLLTFYLNTEKQDAELNWQDKELVSRADFGAGPNCPVESRAVLSGGYPKSMVYKNGVLVVNKKHCLSADYSPGENPEAVANLKDLITAGRAVGIDLIYSWSGFRSFGTQAELYDSYVRQDGKAMADTYSARPGFSEHQTGLAFDLKDSTGNLYRISDSTYDPATDWVALHAHEYGFIVRYFNATKDATGYMGEPWHLRYLGLDMATAVYKSGLTLEEYLEVPGGGYE